MGNFGFRDKLSFIVVLAFAAPATIALSCSSSDESSSTTGAGTQGGPCLPSGGCDIGLVCKTGTCVDAEGGASGGAGGSGATAGTGGSGTGATGGAGTGGGATGGTAGLGGASSGGASGGGAGGAGGVSCNGSHPLLDAGARFCAVGACRCEANDTCYDQAVAASCCSGARQCFGPDGGVTCTSTHPLLDGSARFCATGVCYCAANDACYPAAIAAVCCADPQCS